MDKQAHWEHVYAFKAPNQVSWFSPHLQTSVDFVKRAAADRKASIIDVEPEPQAWLTTCFWQAFATLPSSISRNRPSTSPVRWLCADVTRGEFPAKAYDVWHDRAVFHVLTDCPERCLVGQTWWPHDHQHVWP